jgi:rhodanese-related sulfurtransferase
MDRFLEFTGNHVLLVSLLMASFFLAVFTELRRKASGLINIDATEAIKLINNDAIVIDIRSVESFGRGHIANARNIPSDELDAKVGQLEQYKSKPIIAVCDAGVTSNKAVTLLRQKGFESAYGLRGGMTAWGQAGYPVVSGRKREEGQKGLTPTRPHLRARRCG